jgi:NADH/NAD ratio-sensing transcriptional regulator Rex
MEKRRQFIKNLALGSAGLALGQTVLGRNSVANSAKSYKNIIGANDRIRLAVIGVNGRGTSMAATIASQQNAEVACICDVDERVLPKAVKSVMDAKQITYSPYRKRLP